MSRVVILVRGGNVVDIQSDDESLEALVLDYDNADEAVEYSTASWTYPDTSISAEFKEAFPKPVVEEDDREITFHSVWGNGSHIVSNVVEYNAETGEIQADVIQLSYEPDGGLEEEYIEITDTIEGTFTRKPVCMRCHAHVLKTVMVDDNVGSGMHEELECSECDAE